MKNLLACYMPIIFVMGLFISIFIVPGIFYSHFYMNNTVTVTEETIVLDYESQYYTMHCNAVVDILATKGTNKMAKRKIKTYLEITGAKIQ